MTQPPVHTTESFSGDLSEAEASGLAEDSSAVSVRKKKTRAADDAKSDTAPVPRAEAMAQRKTSILGFARQIIAEQGFDQLKMRDVARLADVTVPTIYNLIGSKQELLDTISNDLVQKLLEVQADAGFGDLSEPFVVFAQKMTTVFASDESYFRAAFVASDRAGVFDRRTPGGIYQRSRQLGIDACIEAQRLGLLLGNIDAEDLGDEVYSGYRLARQDWASGHIELPELRSRALKSVFITLAADANNDYRAILLKRIKALA